MKKLNKLSIIGYGAGDAANNLAHERAIPFDLLSVKKTLVGPIPQN